mgnify:CR=1 FL=1
MCKWGTSKLVTLYIPRPVSGRTEVGVDECIADLIQALNNAKIETTGSCCGHGKQEGSILLKDGRVLTILISQKEKA